MTRMRGINRGDLMTPQRPGPGEDVLGRFIPKQGHPAFLTGACHFGRDRRLVQMAITSKRAILSKIRGYGEPGTLFLGDMPADLHLRVPD